MPDANWLEATDPSLDTDLRVGFPSVTGNPSDVQAFRAWLRKTAGDLNPTVDIYLYEDGSSVRKIIDALPITSLTGQLVTAVWDASELTDSTGKDVECRIYGHASAPSIPSFVNKGTAAATTGTSMSVGYPASIQEGDLLILQIGTTDTSNDNVTADLPTDWSVKHGSLVSGSTYLGEGSAVDGKQIIFYRFVPSGGLAGSLSVTVATPQTNEATFGQMYAFRGVNPSTPFEGGALQSGSGTTVSMPTITTTGPNRLAVAFYMIGSSTTVGNSAGETGGNWQEAVAEDASTTGNDGTIGCQSAAIPSTGTITGGSFTVTTGGWACRGFALIPINTNTVEIGALKWMSDVGAGIELSVTLGANLEAIQTIESTMDANLESIQLLQNILEPNKESVTFIDKISIGNIESTKITVVLNSLSTETLKNLVIETNSNIESRDIIKNNITTYLETNKGVKKTSSAHKESNEGVSVGGDVDVESVQVIDSTVVLSNESIQPLLKSLLTSLESNEGVETVAGVGAETTQGITSVTSQNAESAKKLSIQKIINIETLAFMARIISTQMNSEAGISSSSGLNIETLSQILVEISSELESNEGINKPVSTVLEALQGISDDFLIPTENLNNDFGSVSALLSIPIEAKKQIHSGVIVSSESLLELLILRSESLEATKRIVIETSGVVECLEGIAKTNEPNVEATQDINSIKNIIHESIAVVDYVTVLQHESNSIVRNLYTPYLESLEGISSENILNTESRQELAVTLSSAVETKKRLENISYTSNIESLKGITSLLPLLKEALQGISNVLSSPTESDGEEEVVSRAAKLTIAINDANLILDIIKDQLTIVVNGDPLDVDVDY